MKFDTVCNWRKVTKLISAIVLQNTGEDWEEEEEVSSFLLECAV